MDLQGGSLYSSPHFSLKYLKISKFPNETVLLEELERATLKMPCILDTPEEGTWRFKSF